MCISASSFQPPQDSLVFPRARKWRSDRYNSTFYQDTVFSRGPVPFARANFTISSKARFFSRAFISPLFRSFFTIVFVFIFVSFFKRRRFKASILGTRDAISRALRLPQEQLIFQNHVLYTKSLKNVYDIQDVPTQPRRRRFYVNK